MNLVLLEQYEASAQVTLTDRRAAHLRQVLRVAAGQQVRVGILDGPSGVGTVTEVEPTHVGLSCTFEQAVPPRPAVDLLLALPRPKVLRRLWPQLSALGVGRVLLTNAERVERDYFDAHVVRPEVYRPLLIQGLQQARDTRLPLVTVHRRLKVLIEDELNRLCPHEGRLVADPSASMSIGAAIHGLRRERLVVAVGPEGGWNAFELGMLEQHGFARAGLGGRTLRSDTACVALLALAHDALDRRLHISRDAYTDGESA